MCLFVDGNYQLVGTVCRGNPEAGSPCLGDVCYTRRVCPYVVPSSFDVNLSALSPSRLGTDAQLNLPKAPTTYTGTNAH